MPLCDHGTCRNPATHTYDTTHWNRQDARNLHEPSGQLLKEPQGTRAHIHHLVCAEHTDWQTHEPAYGQVRPEPELDERLEHGPEPIVLCPHCGRPSASWRMVTVDGVEGCLGCLGHPDEKGRYADGS